jgi:hypothetical protein
MESDTVRAACRRPAWWVACVVAVLFAVALYFVARPQPQAAPRDAGGSSASVSGQAADPSQTAGDADALRRICDRRGSGFAGAPVYRGAGPHPTAVLDPTTVAWFGGATNARTLRDPAPIAQMQLVGCLTLGGPASPVPLATCQYREGIEMTLYQGRHRLDVYAVGSGRLVKTLPIDGSSQRTCPPIALVPKGTTATSQNTPPSDSEYTAALDQIINGPAIG